MLKKYPKTHPTLTKLATHQDPPFPHPADQWRTPNYSCLPQKHPKIMKK